MQVSTWMDALLGFAGLFACSVAAGWGMRAVAERPEPPRGYRRRSR